MSDGNQGTEPPTEHRLQEARKKGDTPHSADFGQSLSTLLWGIVLALAGGATIAALCLYVQVLLFVVFENSPGLVTGWMVLHLGFGIGVVCLVGACNGLLPDLLQSRGRWATKREWFDIKRLNPAQRLKSMFGLQKVVQVPLAISRVVVVGALAWNVVQGILSIIRSGASRPWYGGYLVAWQASIMVLVGSSVICLAIGLLDARIQRVLWERRNRMKKDEIQKESKEQEGDPAIKGQRRQLHHDSVNG